MKNLLELKNILYNYVKEYNKLVEFGDSLTYNICLYEDILGVINDCLNGNYDDTLGLSICLDSLYGNKYDELLQCIYASEKLYLLNMKDENINSKIINIRDEIRREYDNKKEEQEDISLKLEYDKSKMISARRVISSLKYSQVISKSDVSNVCEILRELGKDDNEISIFVESLFVHNKDITSKQTGYEFQDKYKFIDLLSLGYEMFEYPDVFNEDKLNKLTNTTLSVLDSDGIDISDYVKVLPVVGKNVNDINELEYVLIRVLEKIREEIDDVIGLIKSEDFILDLNAKNQLSMDCYKLMTKYNLVRDYMDLELKKYSVTEEELPLETSDNTLNNLFYLSNNNGKSYLIEDIKNFPLEYLGKVAELISGFKNNALSKKKNKRMTENASARGFLELKEDQVRVIYKKIKDNNYLIYGAFVKKDDRKYRRQFDSVVVRAGFISDNPSAIEEELMNYINDNGRKWSR